MIGAAHCDNYGIDDGCWANVILEKIHAESFHLL